MAGLSEFMSALRNTENAGHYGDFMAPDTDYFGAYQMDVGALHSSGMLTNESDGISSTNWTGVDGVSSLDDWYSNVNNCQDKAFLRWIFTLWGENRQYNYEHYAGSTLNGAALTMSGMVAAAHLVGSPRFVGQFLASGGTTIPEDGNGTAVTEYLDLMGNFDLTDTSGIDAGWLPAGWDNKFVGHHEWGTDLEGGTGNDILYGFGGGPSLKGDIRDDAFTGATGGVDFLFGGSDVTTGGDSVSYQSITTPLTIQFVQEYENGPDAILKIHTTDGGWSDYINNIETIRLRSDLSVADNASADATADAMSLEEIRIVNLTGSGGIDFSPLNRAIRIDFEAHEFGREGFDHVARIFGFINAIGGRGDDTITGNDEGNGLSGGLGADQLFGGDGDDTLIFDADDTDVQGGDGRDVAIAVTDQAISFDLAPHGVEAVVGGSGDDSFVFGSGSDSLMAAGGDGDDTFTVAYGSGNGPRIVWGGGGDDVINLVSGGDPSAQAGIVTATVAGLTAANFGEFRLEMLAGAEGMNWDLIDVLILNPDAGDSIAIDGEVIGTGTGTEEFTGYHAVYDPTWGVEGTDFVAGTNGFAATVKSGDGGIEATGGLAYGEWDWLGPTRFIQGSKMVESPFELHSVLWTPNGDWAILLYGSELGSNTIKKYINDHFGGAIARWNAEVWYEGEPSTSGNYYQFFLFSSETETAPADLDDLGKWFVTGGSLGGFSLSADGSISAVMPEHSGEALADWLLAA
jgi:hypothetical protein